MKKFTCCFSVKFSNSPGLKILSIFNFNNVDCMCYSCHVCISDWTHTLSLPECQGTPCSTQSQYLKLKWLYRQSNPQLLSSETSTQPFNQTGQMIEQSTYLCREFDCIVLSCHTIVTEWIHTHIVAWMSRNSLLEAGAISEV